MSNDFKFQGVYPALVTPFDETGVNESQYQSLIEHVIRHGATGIVPCGTTGEFTSMTFDERLEAIRIACETANGRVRVMAGTGAPYTADAVRLTRRAAEMGADAALADYITGSAGFAHQAALLTPKRSETRRCASRRQPSPVYVGLGCQL